jgi:hypothetical protein
MVNTIRISKKFKPLSNYKLERIGGNKDGGYVVSSDSLKSSNLLISFGLGDEWSFEKEFQKKTKSKVIIYDASINFKFWLIYVIKYFYNLKFLQKEFFFDFLKVFYYYYFVSKKNITHKKINISNCIIKEKTTDLNEIVKENKNNDFFLKIDIEGDEYQILNDIKNNEKYINGLVIEFHEFNINQNKILNFINNIELKLIHIHVNNFGKLTKKKEPSVLEMTFCKKKFLSHHKMNYVNLPNQTVDRPNNPKMRDFRISFY